MKKKLVFLIIAAIMSLSLVFAACGPAEGQHTHADADSDGKCDVCGEVMPDADDEPNKNPDDNPGGDNPGGDNPGQQDKAVSKIEVSKKPDITEYAVGDTFSLAGGTLLVTYEDGTTEEISMTAEGVEVTPPGLSAPGTKRVKLEYGGEDCTFMVTVVNKSFKVTFELNYDGAPEATVVSVLQGKTAEDPEAERSGYTLVGWYTNRDYIEKFDFETAVTSDLTLYALWTQDGATYHDVTFDYDFYGARITEYSYPVIEGGKVAKPSADPERYGYVFAGWYDTSGAEFDFDGAITADITVVAHWTKDAAFEGKREYVFEAEDVDLTGKSGPALSGQAVETGMIVTIANRNASGDRCVSYLYRNGLYLDFAFASDIAVSDATISVSLSAEYRDFTYNPDNYGIYLNGEKVDYDDIVFTGVPAPDDNYVDCLNFKYYTIGINMPIKEGENVLRLMTENSVTMDGTTLEAAAPMVDAVRINTSAVLTWDGSKGLPFDNY